LSASLLASKIRKDFDVELTLKVIFQIPQIAALSEYIITVKQINSDVEQNSETIIL
jgi:hypothetical protein